VALQVCVLSCAWKRISARRSDENARRLPSTYHSEAEAKEQAEAANKRNQRGAATLAYTLALGRRTSTPEQRVTLSGFKAEIDAT
jgi:uncharacterized protein